MPSRSRRVGAQVSQPLAQGVPSQPMSQPNHSHLRAGEFLPSFKLGGLAPETNVIPQYAAESGLPTGKTLTAKSQQAPKAQKSSGPPQFAL